MIHLSLFWVPSLGVSLPVSSLWLAHNHRISAILENQAQKMNRGQDNSDLRGICLLSRSIYCPCLEKTVPLKPLFWMNWPSFHLFITHSRLKFPSSSIYLVLCSAFLPAGKWKEGGGGGGAGRRGICLLGFCSGKWAATAHHERGWMMHRKKKKKLTSLSLRNTQ